MSSEFSAERAKAGLHLEEMHDIVKHDIEELNQKILRQQGINNADAQRSRDLGKAMAMIDRALEAIEEIPASVF